MLYRFVMHVWVDQANDMLQELLDEHAARLGDDGRNLVEAVSRSARFLGGHSATLKDRQSDLTLASRHVIVDHHPLEIIKCSTHALLL